MMAACLLVCGAASLPAQTAYTWNGGTGDWGSGSFWSTGGVPNDPAASVYIDGGKTGVSSVVAVGGTYSVGTVTVDTGDTLNINTGGSLSVAGGSLVNNGAVNVNSVLQFGSSATLAGYGMVTLGGTGASLYVSHKGDRVTVNYGQTIAGQGTLGNGQTTFTNKGTISADINGGILTIQPGGGAGDFTNAGYLGASNGATLRFANGSGGTLTNNGILGAFEGSTFSVPAGALTNLSGGTLTGGEYVASSASAVSPATFSVGGSVLTNQASIQLGGPGANFNGLNTLATNGSNGALSFNSGNQFTTGGALTNAGNINVDSSTFTVAGSLNNSGYVLANSNGSIIVQGNLVNSGKLATNVVAPTGTITVAGTLTQTATGTLYGAGSITASSFSLGGTIRPADYANNSATAGTLTLNGQVGLLSGTVLLFDLGSTSASDQIKVNGSLTLAGTLTVRAMAGFGTGRYDLIDYTGTLTNNGLALGAVPAGYNYQIDTSIAGQVDLVVTAVPEPSTWTAVLVGSGFFAFVLRRHTRAR